MTAQPSIAPAAVARTAHFTVRAEAEPSVLPRVLEPFVLRNLVPLAVHCRRERAGLRIDVTVAGLEVREVEHLTRRLNQLVPVLTVLASPVACTALESDHTADVGRAGAVGAERG